VTAATQPSTGGINALRLDADRARDELADRLGEVRSRLAPKELAKSASLTVREHRNQFVIAAGSTLVAVAGIIALVVRTKRRG
jgi:hypothetical protein